MLRSVLSRFFRAKAVAGNDEPRKLISRRTSRSDDEAESDVDPFWVGLVDDVREGWYEFEKRQLAPGFPISPDDVVADIGCGEGGAASFCVRCGAHTILIDNDAEVLEQAHAKAAAAGPGRAEARLGDAQKIPLDDGVASRVVCTEVLEHVDDPKAVVRELLRVGRPDALYLISVPGVVAERLHKRVAPAYYFEKPNHIRIFETDEFEKLIEDSGLVIEGRLRLGFFWTLYWLFFFEADVKFGENSHVLLDAWVRTWDQVLKSKNSDQIRAGLHDLAPRSVAVVARKVA